MTGPASLGQGIDAVIDSALGAGRIVGTVVLVRENGAPAYARAAGYADREADLPMLIDTVFRLASLTKPLVTATALALAEESRLGLDDPVTRFLPSFTPGLADGSTPEFSVRHLLTHTAGLGYPSLLPGDPYRAAHISTGLDQPGLSLGENLRRIASAPLYFAPGTAWRYSVATDVLGAITPLPRACRRRYRPPSRTHPRGAPARAAGPSSSRRAFCRRAKIISKGTAACGLASLAPQAQTLA